MITQLPTTPERYYTVFKTMAEKHVNIEHDDQTAERFVVINESMVNPFRGTDIGQLIQNARSKTALKSAAQGGEQKLQMVLLNWSSDLKTPSTRPYTLVDAGFLLIGKVPKNDWDARQETMQLAYETGREILSWIQELFYLNSNILKLSDVMEDPIGPITNENLYGYRFDFEIQIENALKHNLDNFGGYAPARL